MSSCSLKCTGNEVCMFAEDTQNPESAQLIQVCKVSTYSQPKNYGEDTNHTNLIIIFLVVFLIVISFMGFIFFYKLRKRRQMEALHKENRIRVMTQMMNEPIPSIPEIESFDFSLLPYHIPNNTNDEASRSFQSVIYMNPSSTISTAESRLSHQPPPSARTTDSYYRISSQYYSIYEADLEKTQGTSKNNNSVSLHSNEN